MNDVIESIMDEIRRCREDGYEVKEIKLDQHKRNKLLKCDELVRASEIRSTEVDRVCGVDVSVDNTVDGLEVEDDSMEFIDHNKCVFCDSNMMYDEKNSEYYCPICKV